jgi:SSS family solute:Na+ symporter
MLAPAFVVSPVLLQNIYCARDDAAVRWGVGENALSMMLFALIPAALGIVARALHPDLPQRELALPTLLMHDLPPLLGSLGLAAVVSAELSSADAILFMLATSLSRDLYKGVWAPQASPSQVLRVARRAAFVGGALGVMLALLAETVIGALSFFYTLLSVSLFVPVLAGLTLRRAGRREALLALGAGVLALTAAQLGTDGRGLAALSPALLGLLASGAACLVSLAARRRLPDRP